MTGETQHVYTISDAEAGPKEQDKDFGFEGCGEKDGRALGGGSQPGGGEGTSPFPATKDKEPHSQREAVIRPQQAGKIDFKSLHNKPKFAGESGWGGIKGSPQSPPGKGRARERSRRAGKGERGQHQLYRLSIASARPSPTIGIAYPQQKVTPPKVPETSRAPAAGSYRFHVPGVPEEEELSFGRCFPEAAAGRTSANYTSPPAGPPHPPHGPKGQPPAGIPLKSPSTNGQLHYLEFQANGASSWPSPEKSFAGASYGVKPSSFPEGGKAGGHALGALPFQFPFQLLHDSGKEPYRGDAEYLDVALATGQAAHGAFSFHASPREWQEETPGIGSFEGACPPGRLYGVPTPLLAPPPAPHRGPLPCYKGRSEHPADSSGALSSSGAIDQNPSTFQENQAVFPSSLHSPSVPKPVGKGQASAKDSVPSPRLLLPGSPLRRNMPPNSLSQVHFQSKAYCSSPAGSVSAGPVPFETSVPTTAPTHPRLVQAWEGAAKAFSPMDQNSAPYSNPVGSQFSFECQPGPEQRKHRQKNARMPWQQIHLASAVPGQNRIELSRQMSSQKLPFPLGTPEWPGSKAHKGPPLNSSPGYHGKKLLSGESLGAQRGDPGLTGAFSFENGKDPASPACDSRSKALFYSMGQAGPPPPPSRSSSGSALVLPPSALVAASPCGSPLPSPVPNPTCGSTCSSLSPVSSSPLNPSFEDGQLSGVLAPSPFFHHPCHPKEGGKTFHPSEVLTSGSLHYHPQDTIKPFHFPPDALKDDHLLKCSPESPFHKAGVEVAKSCLDGLDGEPPPPPPYASHHLLAGSLSSASLDQLDVLLTCKQCDQNYSNLASFLEHRQFCASHPVPHAEAKEPPRVAEGRRGLPPELPKPPTTTGASLPLSPDPQAHLLALNKGEEFLLDGESKSDGKEDALKGGLFNGLAASSLPLTASDLDIDDAKLDSLITEALNGLGYQSDNPEIDSSFIDVFADEELTGMKAAGSGASHKAKEALASESKPRHAAAEEKEGYCDEDSHTAGERAKRRAGKQHSHKGRAARRLVAREAERPEPAAEERTARLRVGRKNSVPPVSSRSASGQKQPKKHSQESQMKSEAGQGAATKSSKPTRFSTKEGKKRKPRSGTWSKELIHKIVQQKNKLHQLHAKSSKQAQPPLHHERLEPPSQEGRLQEYDYVSDSEDEGAACSRLRGRRKRGAAFMGRAKYSFSKKRPGRGERAKEKDPAWSYSRRRDRQKREAPGHRRASSPEAAKKGDCAGRARRRSSQSSTGSNPSASVATEVGPTDLVGEKAAMPGRRRSGSPARTPRAALGHPEDRSPKKSQKSKEDVSRGTRQVGSAKPLLASPRSHPSTAPDASAGDDAKEEPLPPSQEGQLPSTATSGRSPIRLPHKKEAEEPKGAANQAGEGSPETQDLAGLAMVGQRQQFAPYTGDTVKYHAEELMAPSRSEPSPSSTSAAFSGAGSKYGKAHGVADGGKGFATPGAPFGGDAVGMMLAAKAPDPYVGSDSAFFDPKGLPAHYDANLFSKPPALGSSHMDEMYLCREDIGTGSFEQKHASISPYTTETPQTKVSSPLSFDSSSIFGELPVTEFDSPLYESVSTGKDGYVAAFACPSSAPSKPLPFEQPYPPFMPEKDWSLMEEVAPMLPEDMAHFHGLAVDKPLAKKFPEEGAVPPAQLPLPLPDRMTDYNVAFINNMSDDELEIKRLVTELESQLQTSKLSSEAPTALPKGEHHAAPLRGSAAEPFPPLPADQGHQKGLFMADELGTSSLLATKVCAGERLGGEKPAVTGARGGYEGGREPWHGPAAAFGSLDAGMCTPPSSDGFCPKESGEQLRGAVATEGSGPRRMENEPSSKSPPNPRAPDTAEVPIYTDPPAKSPPAVPNARMGEANKDTLPSLPCKQGAESFPVPGKPGERFGDAAELEKFDAHLPNHNPELGFQPGPATAMDLPFSPHVKEVPDAEERPFGKSKEPQMVKSALDFKGDGGGSALLEEAEERKSPTALPAPGHGDKASKHKALLFHMLSLPKESSSQRTSASQDANPLQQLQLFVARTVKSNEEELLMPCFPVLLAPGHPPAASKGQQELKEESGDGENQAYRPAPGEGDVPVVGNAESVAAPAKEAVPFPGACRQLEPFSAMGSYSAKLSTFAGPELQNNVAELQHLANEDEEANDINIRADGASREQNDLSPLRNAAVTPPPGQGKKADRLVEEQERKDKNKAALAFKTHEQSHLSCGLMEKETLGSATSAGLGTNEAERRAWCQGTDRDEQAPGSMGMGSAPASPTSTLSPSNEPHTHPRLLQDTKINAKLPREGNGKKKSPNGCHYAGESLASLPSPMGFPHPKYLQSGGTEGGESPGFGSQLSEENKYSRFPLNASSSFLVTRCPPEADGNHTHHPTPSPTEQVTWNRTPAFPPLLHHCGTTPTEAGGDGHHQSPESVLGSYGQPEREGMARACAPLRADALVGSAVEVDGAQEPCRKDGSPPCSPFSHKWGGKEGPKSAGAMLPGSHFRENQACTITDMVINSIPLETQNYPTQPTTDLVFTEREVNLNREKKLENCCDDGNKHRNEPEALSNGFVVQQVPAVCRGLKRTGDLGPAESNGHQPSEAAEVRTGDLSKTTEIGEKSLKGEKPKSHRAEHSGEAASCVLNNMGKGEGNTNHSTPSPSQNELQKEKKPNGLQVTCDICSASFRSKPGLTRHKAVKHQVKPGRTPRSALIPADETSRAAQKVPRRSLKAVREKTCGSQVPNAAEHAPKKMCTGLEKEPSAQMQEVVSRVLSDLSVISLEVSQELHRTRVAHREMKAKGQRAETGTGEDPGRQSRKGEKGRRSQSKDPGGVNGNSEKKLNRKVRRRKAKAFPSRHEPDGPCELGKSSGPAPAALSPSLPAVTEGLHEPRGCISTEEQNLPNSSPPKAKQSLCTAELAEDPGDRMVPSEEVSKEPGTGTAPCPEGGEEPGEAESTQACRAWVGGFVKQVEEGLGEVGEEQHRDSTEEMEAETGGSSGGNSTGNWSSAPGGPTSPSPGVPNVQTNDLETPQKAPTHGALQPPPAASPAPAEPKRWAKAELTPSREHHGDNAATSDLQGLFDDDPTFSQLFPRDEQLIRRKCTRVYGKRSKKPKPVAEVSLRPAGAIDLFSIRLASDLSDTGSFCVTREDPCEYETISIDDALMLNMCHSSKARSGEAGPGGSASTALRSDGEKASPGRDVTDLEDNVLTFLCQNSHMDNGPSLSIWAGLEKEGESLAAEGMFEAPVGLENEHSLGETSSEPPDLVEEPYDGKSSEDSDSPEFHTIDIEMLNAKLKMRDVCFFGSCEELPGSGDDGASSFKSKPGQHSKHGRSKLEDGKLGKNRGDITIKAKDKQYKCKVCFQWFLTLGELDFHKLTHNPSPPPTCYMCVQRKFSSREQLRDHLKEKHAKNKAGLWACGMCLKEISDVWMYNEHLREHATQFARKGQAQKSVMGLPACFGEDNDAVTQFLNTIMCRKPSRSSRHAEPSSKHTPSRESRSPRELPPEQEVKAVKEPSESSSVKVKPPAPSSSKVSTSPSPEHPAKSEGTPKSVPMHPDCKDPSRDCHHCGKQFPKPFKLQRHLVVHSLQKIYLCHKCPMFYQETKELRNHLSQEHGTVEEQEIKHTTLYACELCADVMHVIKKSFICSMCNYTFSKKEQYDRHMEKHLAGSNRTFKFRGVMRPGAASKEGREKVREDGVPPSKKRKVAPHGTSADRLGHAGDLQLVDPASPSLQPPSEPFPGAPRDPAAPQPQPPVKTEDLVGDFSDLLAEMEKSQFDTLPPPPCLSPSLPQAAAGGAELGHIAALSIEELEKGAFDGKPLPFLDSPGFSLDLAGLACNQATDQKLSPPHLTEKRGYADAHKRTNASNKDEYIAGGLENPDAATDAVDGIPFLQLAKKVSELPSQGAEAPPAKETHRTQWGNPSTSEASCWEGASKATSPEAAHQPLPLKDKTASPALNRAAKDSASQKKNTGNQPGGEAAPEEGQQGSVAKDKSAPDGGTKESSAGTRDHGGNPSRSSGHQLRGDSASHTAKLHPKRRKEHKSLSHRGSAGSRENMEGDGKKKKGRAPGPGRSESSGELKRADWSIAETPALSPGRRDAHGNRLLPRPKMGTQLKKMVLDACNQKKGELRHANGDVRRRKAILGKSLHQVLAKGTAPAPRGSLHGSRPARGTKPAGSASYRTAESQNNLLSQLFGQKLTSFKIPLRRETSE